MPQPTYRPFVTFPNGQEAIIAANVVTHEDRQAALNVAGQMSCQMAGVTEADAAKLSPQRIRELSAKVEFFRVAQG